MDDKDLLGFSWSALFIVTSICSFIFTGVIWLLDGKLSIVFLVIGVAALVLAILNMIFKALKHPDGKKVDSNFIS